MNIEKGVPIPGSKGIAAAIAKMEIGDSAIIKSSSAKEFRRVARAVGYSVTTKPINESETRLWFLGRRSS